MFRKKRFLAVVLAVLLAFTAVPSQAASIYTKKSTISKKTDKKTCSVRINGDDGVRTFTVFDQRRTAPSGHSFIAQHGCAACALTCVLTGYTKKYKNYTPEKTRKRLEKKVFGTAAWSANYSKSLSAQRPVSLYGMTKILNYCHVPSRYVRTFTDQKAVKQITRHLKSGNAVIIEVNNHKQKNGVYSASYDTKWALSKHTMVLLGLTKKGKVIVADSATRSWSGKKQRIKFTTVEQLVQYMIPCKSKSKDLYYKNTDVSGGYILVND